MREYLGGHSDGDSLGALSEQERETDRKLGRLLVTSVVGCHPVGDLRVEDDLLGEFAQTGLDVTGRSVAVTGKDVTPVPLAVDCITFLTELDKRSENGSITMRMIVHGLADNSRDLAV